MMIKLIDISRKMLNPDLDGGGFDALCRRIDVGKIKKISICVKRLIFYYFLI